MQASSRTNFYDAESVNGGDWQIPPLERHQIVLFETCLEDRIPDGHPVRLLDEILEGLDWTQWENTYNRRIGQPPIHPKKLRSKTFIGR